MKKKVAKFSQRLSCSFDHSFEFECKCLHLVATCQNFNNQDRHRQHFLSGGGGGSLEVQAWQLLKDWTYYYFVAWYFSNSLMTSFDKTRWVVSKNHQDFMKRSEYLTAALTQYYIGWGRLQCFLLNVFVALYPLSYLWPQAHFVNRCKTIPIIGLVCVHMTVGHLR